MSKQSNLKLEIHEKLTGFKHTENVQNLKMFNSSMTDDNRKQ